MTLQDHRPDLEGEAVTRAGAVLENVVDDRVAFEFVERLFLMLHGRGDRPAPAAVAWIILHIGRVQVADAGLPLDGGFIFQAAGVLCRPEVPPSAIEPIQRGCERKQFGVLLKDQQLIQQMMTGMITSLRAARLLCYNAGYLKDIGAPHTIMETWIAKYFASTAAAKAASDAVQIHGANGCSSAYPVQRYWRDTKVMEIIEGSTQIQEINIASYGYQGLYA